MILEKRTLKYRIRRKIQIIAYNLFGPECVAKIYYLLLMKRPFHINNPISFNEKLSWYKLRICPNNETIIQCSDKYKVREYLEDKGYDDNLIKLLGVWDDSEKIDFEKLPNQFVLKCNHGSGYNIVCDDKKKLNLGEVKAVLNSWMKESFGKFNAEPHYDLIEKKIICEEYIGDQKGNLPKDYKFHCFNGQPRFIEECSDRKAGGAKFLYYDINGIPLDYSFSISEKKLEIEDDVLEKMLKICYDLSAPFQYVRIDFYYMNNKIYIGELTFTSGAGLMNYFNKRSDFEIGEFWIIDR